jgi:Protein of unknown function (DUF3500)
MKSYLALRLLQFLALAVAIPLDVARAHPVGEAMTDAANKFLAGLTAEQRAKAVFEWKSDERENWHFIPRDRQGLPLRELKPEQRALALALLAEGLSHQGYAKATNIMTLESVLADLEGPNRRFPRDPELYYFSVFGKPEATGTWGWRVEGHHIAANFTIVNGRFFASTPSFLGANPAKVLKGPRQGVRVLALEEDYARDLVTSLNWEQRKLGILSTNAPKEIFTEAKRRAQPLEPAGLPASQLSAEQKEMLMKLVREYVQRVRPELATDEMERIRQAGLDKIHFAWAGGLAKGEGHYYRVQGPTFLLEYDNTQNDNNHIHAVWRDFNGDFGEDILKKHYLEVPHGK